MIACTKGLDIIGFLMRIEDFFEVTIHDPEIERVNTVGDLWACIREKVSTNHSGTCLTARSFYLVRRSLIRVTGRAREAIRPDTPLAELLPHADRRRQWNELKIDLHRSLPRLRWPGWVSLFITFVLALLAIGAMGNEVKRNWMPMLAWPLAAVVVALTMWLTRPLALHLPYSTVGDMARNVWAMDAARTTMTCASDQQLWEAIANILSEEAGIESALITRELRFDDIPGDL
jgi:hypothetical protein